MELGIFERCCRAESRRHGSRRGRFRWRVRSHGRRTFLFSSQASLCNIDDEVAGAGDADL